MIRRLAIHKLREWRYSEDRKPLIIRGVRQVGKTTLVKEFAKEFDVFLHLNLERSKDSELFETTDDVAQLLQSIYFHKKQEKKDGSVLLFIDEIQNSKRAVAMLRYFYEEAPEVHVIVAGSLLETVMDVRKISFPVGRVEFMSLRPCSFLEFLGGLGEDFDKELVENFNIESVVHDRVMQLFREYVLVGGMPAVIVQYAKKRDILSCASVFNSLLQAYKDDVEKYTSSKTMVKVIRTIMDYGWQSAAETISFEGFGGTSYRSREMSEAFQIIAKAMLTELVYPTSDTQVPILPNFKKRPKLLWVDTGIVNYASKVQNDVFSAKDICDVWRGRIAEHIVAQELVAYDNDISLRHNYWRRDKEGSDAEVDFLYQFKSLVVPIEVKSGHNAKLKSLHLFMEKAPHAIAIRVWSNPYSVDNVTTSGGKQFKLVNVPFYYVGQIERILEKELS